MRRNPETVALATLFAAASLLGFLAPSARANSAPVVTNVVATQIPNTGQVRVTFDVSDVDGDQVTARLVCSSNGDATYDLYPSTISGDVNRVMAAGPGKQVLWDAAHDYPGRHFTQVVAKVVVSDGPATSGEMVLVPAGTFAMGSSDPEAAHTGADVVHSVTLDAYWIDKYEVTNAEYQLFMDAGGYTTQAFWSSEGWAWRTTNAITTPSGWAANGPCCPGYPVGGVSYFEAEAYARFAGKRLPTEAEWEYAARGNDGRNYPWGDSDGSHRANFFNSGDPFDNALSPVGFFDGRLHPNPPYQTLDSPSPFGAYDMCGNVWEWVYDWWGTYPSSPVSNPTGPATGGYKVIRGGAATTPYVWFGVSEPLRSYARYTCIMDGTSACQVYSNPNTRSYFLGFRCARSGL